LIPVNPKKRKPPELEEIYVCDVEFSGRHRKDMGDLNALGLSIAEVGLLQPIVVTKGRRLVGGDTSADGRTFRTVYRLVAGERRLRAVVGLDRTTIKAYVVSNLQDAAALLRAERDESTCRKEFTPSEAVAIGTELEKIEKAKAKDRQKETQAKPGQRVGTQGKEKFSTPDAGRATDKVAEAVGMSRPTYEKAKKVVEAAREDPAAFGDLPNRMDQTGKVHQAHQEMKRRQRRQELEQKAATAGPLAGDAARVIEGDCLDVMCRLESGGERFRLVFADPPYNEGVDYGDGSKADQLPDEVFLDGIRCRLEAASRLRTGDGSLWVLISNRYTPEFVLMLRGLGLHQRALITWYETFGVNCARNFNRCSRHLLYFVKDPARFVFSPDAVNRASDRQKKYNDRRADQGGKNWDEVWGIDPSIPRLFGTASSLLKKSILGAGIE
jgi:hypothetical protein